MTLILLYYGNSVVFRYLYDTSICTGWVEFYATRNIIYEVMFFLFCLATLFPQTPLSRALFAFLLVMIFGSIVDKAIFKITDYLWTDAGLTLGALYIARKIYRHDRRMERN